MPEAIGLVVLLPLLGFLIIALFGQSLSERAVAIVACAVVGLGFLAALAVIFGTADGGSRVFEYDWTVAGSWTVRFGFLADRLSAFMACIVTGVGFLIHLYSVGYMTGEKDFKRFFAYLNLFVFAMLLLVSADNYVLLMVGWAGVGLSSFLLIGFYTERPSAVAAARKAFVVNTIGDVGLMLGTFVIFANTNSVDYANVFSSPNLINVTNSTWVNWAALLLFIGCAAKSAQIPLQNWLPDAMEGPTPVSALIHAATMVTAGVYLVVRSGEIFGRSDLMLAVIPIIGALTAIYAATCALAQTDLKRVLAYSTVSQLGYMFMAAGVGAYQSALFHLLTHAFFKALLFLSAGAVIHGLGGEQDMRRMGGLGRKMPLARWTFLIGALAISGIPPFAGFFSKESILGNFPLLGDGNGGIHAGLNAGSQALIGWVGVITALLTAFYMFRAYFMTFEGEPAAEHHVHASSQTINIPLIVLGILSTVGGFIAFPGLWNGFSGYFNKYFPSFLAAEATAQPSDLIPNNGTIAIPVGSVDWTNLIIALAAGLIGIALAYFTYQRVWSKRPIAITPATGISAFLYNAWYIDTAYYNFITVPIRAIGGWIARGIEPIEQALVDRGIGSSIWQGSRGVRRSETGYVRNYALVMMLGVVAILIYVAVAGLQR